MASSSSSGPCTLVMPTLDPARAGLTKTGKPSAATVSRTAALSVAQARGVTTAYGPTGSPAPCSSVFMCPLSIAAAEAKTPDPTYGTPASSSSPCSVPSSPYGAVQQRQDDVDLAELLGHRARLVDREPAVGRVAGEHDRRRRRRRPRAARRR